MNGQDVVELDPIVDRVLARSNGAYDDEFVRVLVESVASQFENARVRDFLPVLIAKMSADELRRLGGIATVSSLS